MGSDEEQYFDRESKQVALDHEKERLESDRQDRDERRTYGNKIFCLICCWLVGLAALLMAQGFEDFPFKLETGVMLAVVGGTTINVLGLFVIVANYLFPKRTK